MRDICRRDERCIGITVINERIGGAEGARMEREGSRGRYGY
jgi:hypothetical protein